MSHDTRFLSCDNNTPPFRGVLSPVTSHVIASGQVITASTSTPASTAQNPRTASSDSSQRPEHGTRCADTQSEVSAFPLMRVTDAEVTDSQVVEIHTDPTGQDDRSAQSLPTPASSGELPPVDADLFERAREAVQALRRQRAVGQRGNLAAMKTGLRSTQLLNAPDVAGWHEKQVAAIESDLGGTAELSTLARGAVREAARLEVILGALGTELLEHGVLTGKGKTRAATNTYLHVLDRYVKLSATLGLGRREKQVPSVRDVLKGEVS